MEASTTTMETKSQSYDLTIILNKILESKNISDIAKDINVSIGTVKRWIDLNNVVYKLISSRSSLL